MSNRAPSRREGLPLPPGGGRAGALAILFLLHATAFAADPAPSPAAATPTPAAIATPAAIPTPVRAKHLTKIAVLAAGDPAAAGELQRELERGLGRPDVIVRGASDIAAIVGSKASTAPAPASVDGAALAQSEALFQDATGAYYQDKGAQALDKLGELGALQARTPGFSVADKVRLHLWRTAVFFSLGDQAQSESEALAALTLDPSLAAGLKEFPPSLIDVIEKVRKEKLQLVTLIVAGLPPGAQVRVDDRAASARSQVPIGHHTVTAWAPGRGAVTKGVDAAADASVTLTLPVALDAALADAVDGAVWRDALTDSDRTALGDLAKRLGVDWLAVASVRAGENGAAAGGSHDKAKLVAIGAIPADWPSETQPATSAGAAAIGAWAGPALEGAVPALEQKRRALDAEAAKAAMRRTRSLVSVRGGAIWAARQRTLSSDSGSSFPSTFVGFGPRVSVEIVKGAIEGSLEGAWIDYGISNADVTLSGGAHQTVSGGSTTLASGALAWRHAFGPDFEEAPVISLGAAYSTESHAAHDASDPSLGRLGLYTSYSTSAIEARAGGRYPLWIGRTRLGLSARVGYAPFASWSESPAGMLGTSPKVTGAASWRLGAAFEPAGKWDLALEYGGLMRTVSFSGTGTAPMNPDLQGAKIAESVQTLSVTARWGF